VPHAIRRQRPVSSITVPLVALAMAFGVISAAASPGSVAAATTTVRVTDRLEPAELRVAVGTTVRWVNADGERHRMRSQSGPDEFDSGNLEPGESYSMRLTVAGTYTYLDERDDENSR
jgi:plastocyanin